MNHQGDDNEESHRLLNCFIKVFKINPTTCPIQPASSSGFATVADKQISWTSFGQYMT